MKFALLAIALAVSAYAQARPDVYYVESFRHGPTRITETTFEIELNNDNREYRARIKDSHRADRYLLTISPQGPEGDTKVTSWVVKLVDLRHSIFDNVLRVSQEPSTDPKTNLWDLQPGTYAPVPISARRIIKVDSFYVVVQVESHHFTPIDSPYLDTMTLQVRFSNTDPRAATP